MQGVGGYWRLALLFFNVRFWLTVFGAPFAVVGMIIYYEIEHDLWSTKDFHFHYHKHMKSFDIEEVHYLEREAAMFEILGFFGIAAL